MNITKKPWIALVFTVAMCVGQLSFAAIAAKAASDDTTDVTLSVTYGQTEGRTIFNMVNAFRTGDEAWYWNADNTTKTECSNLSELVYDYDLEAIAMQRAAEIAIYYAHTRPDNTTCWTAYADYSWTNVGENIAAGYRSASAVFTGWQETDETYSGQGHRRNMLSSSYTAVGIGHVYYNGYHYWVQEFAQSTNSSSETTANDSVTAVPVTIALDNITNQAITANVTSYQLSKGSYAVLPELTITLTLNSTWPSTYVPVTMPYSWSSQNTDCVSLSENQLIARAEGSTNLTTTVLGEEITIPVTVTSTAEPTSETSSQTSSQTSPKKPKTTAISKLTAKSKGFQVTWKKISTQVTGYQIQYSTKRKFTKHQVTKTIKNNKTTTRTVKKLKPKKKYFVRIRTYRTINGKKYYSAWSQVKSVTTKK